MPGNLFPNIELSDDINLIISVRTGNAAIDTIQIMFSVSDENFEDQKKYMPKWIGEVVYGRGG